MDFGKTFTLVMGAYLAGGFILAATVVSGLSPKKMTLGSALGLAAVNGLGMVAVLWVTTALTFTNR